MNQQTRVQNVKIRTRVSRLSSTEETSQAIELPQRRTDWGKRFLRLDKLVRDFAVVGCLMLVVIAVRNAGGPQAQSVFGVLQESAGIQWDESLGKLSFVNSLLPENVREVWNETRYSTEITMPVDGEVVHVWSVNEPYLLISDSNGKVEAAASGEVMSIAHGWNEERIVRLRHEDHTETIYGNLQEASVEVGEYVMSGDAIGTLLAGQPLAFELRIDGKAMDPSEAMWHYRR